MRNETPTRTGSDTECVLAIVRSHAEHEVARLDGYVLLARCVSTDGTLWTHAHKSAGQEPKLTAAILRDGDELLA